MSKICFVTGKHSHRGGRISRKGIPKKSGGIGTYLVKRVKRSFKPNLQRVRVRMPNGQIRRIWVSAKAIKAGKITKC